MTPRSCLRWKPTGRIFKTIGLRWVPTGKIFAFSTNKVDSEPTNGSNDDITNQYECKQTLDVSAGTLNIHAGTSLNPTKEGLRVCSELGIHDHSNEPSSSKLVPKVVPPAVKTATSRQELELLFHNHITMLRTPVMQGTTFPSDSSFSQKKLVTHLVTEDCGARLPIDFLIPKECGLMEWSWERASAKSESCVIHKDGDGDASFALEVVIINLSSCSIYKRTFDKQQDSRIMKSSRN
ncbi:hypothetical protein Tco_1345131 [Tanacetum coccineum]